LFIGGATRCAYGTHHPIPPPPNSRFFLVLTSGAGRGRKLIGMKSVNLIVGWCGQFLFSVVPRQFSQVIANWPENQILIPDWTNFHCPGATLGFNACVSAMRRTLAAAAAAGGGGGGLPSSAAQVGASRRIVDYMPFLSLTSVRRQPSPIRSLQPYMDTPGMVSNLAG